MSLTEAVTTAYAKGCKMKRIPFCWDMINVDSIEIPHGLNLDHIAFITPEPVQISISDDSDKLINGLLNNGGSYTLKKDAIVLYRPKDGLYDGPNYDDINALRGFVVLYYKPIP